VSRRRRREVAFTVTALDEDGLGRGQVELAEEGLLRAVAARNALPGERVAGPVRQRRRGVWYVSTESIAAPAAERVHPPCPNFPRCGGCALQHQRYDAQLAGKAALLERLLDERGLAPQRWRSPVSGPRLHYRHKARLGARLVGDELLVGFRVAFSNHVMSMAECRTLIRPFADRLPLLRDTLDGLSVRGALPQVELAAGDDRQALIIRHLEPLSAADRQRLEAFAAVTGFEVLLQPSGPDSITPLHPAADREVLLRYSLEQFGVLLEFEPQAFTQVNLAMNRELVSAAVTALDLRPGSRVVDLFCGIGNFSLPMARRGGQVVGLEGTAAAVERARRNARLNGLEDACVFAVADLYDAGAELPQEAHFMLLDPPRSGAGPNLDRWLGQSALERAVYVSCNPHSFAADAAVFAAHGFELHSVGVFDMFPHTAHLETLGVFQR